MVSLPTYYFNVMMFFLNPIHRGGRRLKLTEEKSQIRAHMDLQQRH